MKVVAVLNEKGGCGKTTLSTNLARALQLRGHEVLLVDSDPQGTARDWKDAQDKIDTPAVVGVDRPTIHKDIAKLTGFDFVVIDGAAKLSDLSASGLRAADVVLIPVQPSAADVWATSDLVDLIQRRQEVTGGPRAAFVVSRQIVGTNLAGDIEKALDSLELPILEGRTSQRVVYADAIGLGVSVLDLGDKKAKEEIQTITEETIELCRKAAPA